MPDDESLNDMIARSEEELDQFQVLLHTRTHTQTHTYTHTHSYCITGSLLFHCQRLDMERMTRDAMVSVCEVHV